MRTYTYVLITFCFSLFSLEGADCSHKFPFVISKHTIQIHPSHLLLHSTTMNISLPLSFLFLLCIAVVTDTNSTKVAKSTGKGGGRALRGKELREAVDDEARARLLLPAPATAQDDAKCLYNCHFVDGTVIIDQPGSYK